MIFRLITTVDYFCNKKDCTKDQQNSTKLFLPHNEKVIGNRSYPTLFGEGFEPGMLRILAKRLLLLTFVKVSGVRSAQKQ
jgi:hypothetical protein